MRFHYTGLIDKNHWPLIESTHAETVRDPQPPVTPSAYKRHSFHARDSRVSGDVCQESQTKIKSLVFVLIQLLSLLNNAVDPHCFLNDIPILQNGLELRDCALLSSTTLFHALAHCLGYAGNHGHLATDQTCQACSCLLLLSQECSSPGCLTVWIFHMIQVLLKYNLEEARLRHLAERGHFSQASSIRASHFFLSLKPFIALSIT